MKFSLSLLASLILSLAVPASASPHPHPRLIPANPSDFSDPPSGPLHPRHDDPDCDGTHTYTATYTSDTVRTYTILSVTTTTETYTSLRTSTRPRRPHGTRTTIETWTQVKTQTQTVTNYAPTATVTVTKTQTDTEQTAIGTRTTVTVFSTPSAAAPSASASPGGGGECNTGSLQCCDTIAPANSPAMSGVLSAIGVALDVLNGLGDGLVGTSCSPISALSVGGGVECNQSPVCCNNNTYQGLINIGCVPIQL